MEIITVNELLEGKPILIKNKQYLSTKAYVEPFIERMSAITSDFIVQVISPDQMSLSGDNKDVMFNRVYIQAVLPDSYYSYDNHKKVVGLVYGLDVKIPVAKLFIGGLNMACTNLCVFSPDYLNVQNLDPESPINYNPIKELLEKQDNLNLMLKQMKDIYVSRNQRTKYLGDWIDFTIREDYSRDYGKIKLANSTPIDVYKSLFIDNESPYYTPEEAEPNMFDIYNAFTDVIRADKRDILNKYEKVYLIARMLGLA